MRGESERVAGRVRELLGESGSERLAAVVPAGAPVSWWVRARSRVPVRVDPGRRAAVAVGLAASVAGIVTAFWVFADRPRAVPVAVTHMAGAASPVGTSAPTAPASGTSAPAAVIVVDVAGKVIRPGLYRLPAGSRVNDAIAAAGGALAGANLISLNLAARVVDGQQILVGVAGAVPNPAGSSAGTSAPVNLNTATAEVLETLPGVGPVLAEHILAWRGAHGGFVTVDQLTDVAGIGEVTFAELRSRVTV